MEDMIAEILEWTRAEAGRRENVLGYNWAQGVYEVPGLHEGAPSPAGSMPLADFGDANFLKSIGGLPTPQPGELARAFRRRQARKRQQAQKPKGE
jgi:hypothetical protein